MKGMAFDLQQPAEVEAGAGLVVHALSGRGARLVVSLAGVGTERGKVPPPEFIGTASAAGEHHVLFISDPRRSWMNGPGVAAAMVDVIETYRARHDITEVVLLGNSMGGFAALVLAGLIPVNTVIAFSPQYSMCPDLVPEEYRWQRFARRIESWAHPHIGALGQAGTNYYLFHGDAAPEAWHWLRFPHHAQLNHFIFRGQGHDVVSRMHKRRMLAQVFNDAVAHRPRWLRMTMERSPFGRRFNVYRREAYHQEFPGLRLEALAGPDRKEDHR